MQLLVLCLVVDDKYGVVDKYDYPFLSGHKLLEISGRNELPLVRQFYDSALSFLAPLMARPSDIHHCALSRCGYL